jgi:hypothetical protein
LYLATKKASRKGGSPIGTKSYYVTLIPALYQALSQAEMIHLHLTGTGATSTVIDVVDNRMNKHNFTPFQI